MAAKINVALSASQAEALLKVLGAVKQSKTVEALAAKVAEAKDKAAATAEFYGQKKPLEYPFAGMFEGL